LNGIGQRHSFDRSIVEPDDQIAGTDARLGGWRVVDGRNHLDKAIFLAADFDSQSAKLTGRADLQVLKSFGVQKSRVRIEIAQHAANGVFQQILILDRLDVILSDST